MNNILGSLTPNMSTNNMPIKEAVTLYSIGIIKDTNLNNCLSFDGTNVVMRPCPIVLNQYDDRFRFKFTGGEVRTVNDSHCFTKNQDNTFNFTTLKYFDSGVTNCHRFKSDSNFPIKSTDNTCLGNNLDKLTSINCNVSNWKMTMTTM